MSHNLPRKNDSKLHSKPKGSARTDGKAPGNKKVPKNYLRKKLKEGVEEWNARHEKERARKAKDLDLATEAAIDMGFVEEDFQDPTVLREVGVMGALPEPLPIPDPPLPVPPAPFYYPDIPNGAPYPAVHTEVPVVSLSQQLRRKSGVLRSTKKSDKVVDPVGTSPHGIPRLPTQETRDTRFVSAASNGLQIIWHESMWIFQDLQDVLLGALKALIMGFTLLSLLCMVMTFTIMCLNLQVQWDSILVMTGSPMVTILILICSLAGVCLFSANHNLIKAVFGFKHVYTFGKPQPQDLWMDRRPHSFKNVDVAERDPILTPVRYQKLLFGVFEWDTTEFFISSALLSDLAIPRNLDPSSTDAVAYERIKFNSERCGYINIDRWAQVAGIPLVQNTAHVAYALFRQNAEKLRRLPFPKSQPA